MAVFFIVAGLGVVLGLVFRPGILLIASVLVPAVLFVTDLATGERVAVALIHGVTGLVALQLGCIAGALAVFLTTRRREPDAPAEGEAAAPDAVAANVDRPLSTNDAPFLAPRVHDLTDLWVYPGDVARRLPDLFRRSPGFMAVTKGPDHVVVGLNDAMAVLIGDRAVVGKPIGEAVPELVGQKWLERLDHAFASGESVRELRASILIERRAGRPLEERFIDIVLEPLRDAGGGPVGVMMGGHDVTDSVTAQRRIREMERLMRSTIDTLAKHVAVITEDGSVVASNRAWRDMYEGDNFLVACARAAAAGDRDAARIAALIREVASGEAKEAVLEYEFRSGRDQGWYELRAVGFADGGPMHVVLTREDVTERKRSASRVEFLATHDSLTGLPNRTLLEDRTQRAIEQAKREGRGLALLTIDLDNFKYLNDAYSHSVGDATLRACADRIAAGRKAGDTTARLGSDEFVVVLGGASDAGMDAVHAARSIIEQIGMPLTLGGHEFAVTASVGISLFPNDGEDFDALLKNAQAAMYRAKAPGRGGYQFYSPEMSARANERMVIEGELRRALRLDQFELHFQPQVDTRSGDLIGMEALIRWRHPELGWLPPSRFIPIAEETGLIGQLGAYVLREACARNRAWQREGLPAVPVAVNIAAAQLRDPGLLTLIEETLAETEIDPATLELEVTEGMMMDASEGLLARLDFLKRLGVRLSIDDFGTGYSNLGYLRTFPLDRLKIDRSFVATMTSDEGSRKIVRAILGLGHSFGLEVIAEGVETREQADLLVRYGCTQAQGFLYAAPMPADALIQWVRARRAAEDDVMGPDLHTTTA